MKRRPEGERGGEGGKRARNENKRVPLDLLIIALKKKKK